MIIYFAPVRKRAHFTQLFFATQCERRACNRERRRGERDRCGGAAAALSALDREGWELILCYEEIGDLAQAGWVAQ